MRPERAKGALWKSAIFVRRRRLSRVEAEGVFPILLILLRTSSSFEGVKRTSSRPIPKVVISPVCHNGQAV